ncbi:MAG: Dickkopf N-terminal cysteine-rich domain-containing protein [Myxococcota bacterium]
MSRLGVVSCAVASFAAAWLVAHEARANLCKPRNLTGRHTDEAARLSGEAFAQGAYLGDADYNARIIGCNRKRDNKGGKLERTIAADHVYPQDLPPKLVRGKLYYYGKFWVRYGYQLERESGEWVLTVPIDFDLPPLKQSDKLDIPIDLADSLGLTGTGDECDPGERVLREGVTSATKSRDIEHGHVPGSIALKGAACRLDRDEAYGGTDLTTHFMEYWRSTIEAYWSRPGLRVEVVLLDVDTVDDDVARSFKKFRTTWKVKLNHNPGGRPTYRAVAFKPRGLYSGLPVEVIAHEFGHTIGLDDEYADASSPPSWRDCDALGGSDYCMCDDDDDPTYAKGVYAWVVTRRYAVAKGDLHNCKSNADCPSRHYCDKGTLTIGKNTCRPMKGTCDACSADKQCLGDRICKGKPAGKCIVEASRDMGEECCRNAQCASGSCDKDGRCQCRHSDDCADGEYCDTGTLGVGRNSCVAYKATCEACSADKQCAPPEVCKGKPAGKCVEEDSVALGESCCRDAQCATGACSAAGVCQCKEDDDCANGEYCDKGTLGVGRNTCQAYKVRCDTCSADKQCAPPAICKGKPAGKCVEEDSRDVGQTCCRNAECRSGSCNKDGVCQCKDNGDCPDGEYCDTGTAGIGRNTCVDYKDSCESCSADKQCGPGSICKGKPVGKCIDEGSKSYGQSCCKNAQCSSGKCQGGACTCKDDGDCPGNQRCKKPLFKKNYCE